MQTEWQIARRLYYSSAAHRTARPAVRVALAGITIGVTVMLITVCVVIGFKQTVTEKVAGFGAHIQITSFDNNNTYEYQPIFAPDSMLTMLRSLPHVESVNTFATKPGMLKTGDAFQGIVLKGLPITDANASQEPAWQFFSKNLIDGSLPKEPNDILLSQENARLLSLKVGESVLCYFVGDALKVRKFNIAGIYSSSFAEYDKLFVVCPLPTVIQLNGWQPAQVSGIELRLDDLSHLDEVYDDVYFAVANRLDEEGSAYYPQSVIQMHPAVFYWLDLLDMNVWVIIILMLAVSGFNIVSGLIILILDAIPLIGILKALGADNRFIRRIFIHEATILIGKGMLWGNILGLSLAALQYFFHLIPLDAATYYVPYVPVAFPWIGLILLNVLILGVSLLTLLAPTSLATRISPAKVMHFE
ncbi:MAG: ABC transporter permease [Paludibacteraceae bacterium]|nr:ABC transporter permease [Paludibacteraceae bacterium]